MGHTINDIRSNLATVIQTMTIDNEYSYDWDNPDSICPKDSDPEKVPELEFPFVDFAFETDRAVDAESSNLTRTNVVTAKFYIIPKKKQPTRDGTDLAVRDFKKLIHANRSSDYWQVWKYLSNERIPINELSTIDYGAIITTEIQYVETRENP